MVINGNMISTCRFGSLLACETFHADVHAGNLWLLRDGRIGFLDFGIYSLLTSHVLAYSFDLFEDNLFLVISSC